MRYTAIFDVSSALADVIRKGVVPGIIAKGDSVGLCSPAQRGDYTLGIYLYKIGDSESFRISGKSSEGLYGQKYPPMVLDLYYMITPYFKTDVKFLAEQEQIVLGKVLQTLRDNSGIFTETSEPVTLETLTPSLDEAQKIWSFPEPYRISVYVAARAVILESARSAEISRVTDIRVDARFKRKGTTD